MNTVSRTLAAVDASFDAPPCDTRKVLHKLLLQMPQRVSEKCTMASVKTTLTGRFFRCFENIRKLPGSVISFDDLTPSPAPVG